MTVIGRTDKMSYYLNACDVIFTKPGGLTSTEAAVAESVSQVAAGVRLMEHPEELQKMREKQRLQIPKDSARQICEFIRMKTGR